MNSPDRAALVAETESFVRQEMANDSTGHDWWHAVRVRAMTVRLVAESP